VKPKPLRPVTDAHAAEVLADTVAMRIVQHLDDADRTVAELAERLRTDVATVDDRLRLLAEADHVERRGDRWGTSHRLVVPDETWARLSEGARQRYIDELLEEVSEELARATVGGAFSRTDAHLSWTPAQLDAQGFAEASELFGRLLADLDRVRLAAAERLAATPTVTDGAEAPLDAFAVLLLFERQPGD
jgi:DNA-binding MarR family transcriptional regulator